MGVNPLTYELMNMRGGFTWRGGITEQERYLQGGREGGRLRRGRKRVQTQTQREQSKGVYKLKDVGLQAPPSSVAEQTKISFKSEDPGVNRRGDSSEVLFGFIVTVNKKKKNKKKRISRRRGKK